MNNSIFDTVNILLAKGLTMDEAIKKAELKLRCPIPEHIKVMIREATE